MTGIFGEAKTVLSSENAPKNALNLLEEVKKANNGRDFDDSVIIPVTAWLSNHQANIEGMQRANRYFYYADKATIKRLILLGRNPKVTFTPYPKKAKEDEETLWLADYVKRLYGWSDREYNFYRHLIDLRDRELHHKLNKTFGFTKEEHKKLGLPFEKLDEKFTKPKPKAPTGFFA